MLTCLVTPATTHTTTLERWRVAALWTRARMPALQLPFMSPGCAPHTFAISLRLSAPTGRLRPSLQTNAILLYLDHRQSSGRFTCPLRMVFMCMSCSPSSKEKPTVTRAVTVGTRHKATEVSRQLLQVPSGNQRPQGRGAAPARGSVHGKGGGVTRDVTHGIADPDRKNRVIVCIRCGRCGVGCAGRACNWNAVFLPLVAERW